MSFNSKKFEFHPSTPLWIRLTTSWHFIKYHHVNPFSAEPFVVNCLCGWQGVNGVYSWMILLGVASIQGYTLKWPACIRIRAHSTERVNPISLNLTTVSKILPFMHLDGSTVVNRTLRPSGLHSNRSETDVMTYGDFSSKSQAQLGISWDFFFH